MLCTRASAFTYVNVPLCPAVFCEALAPVHPAGDCIPLHFAVCVCAPAPVHALSLLLSTCVWIPHVCRSAFLHSSIVSGLSPLPSLVSTAYIISVWRVPFFPSWLGCQDLPAIGAVSSRNWLPRVEAPGCLGHLTSI